MTEDKTSSPDLSQGNSPWEKLDSAAVTDEGLERIRSPLHSRGRRESSREVGTTPRVSTRGGASGPPTPRTLQVMSPSAMGGRALTPRSDGKSEGGLSLSGRRGAECSDGALRPSTPPTPPSRWLGGEDQKQVIEGMIRTMSEAVKDGSSITMQLMTKVSEQDNAVWSGVRVQAQAQAENLPKDSQLKSECEAFQEEVVRRAREAWNAAVSELGQAARDDEARREAREVQLRAELLQAWERLQARAQDTVQGEVRKAEREVSRVRQEESTVANRERVLQSELGNACACRA